MLTRTTLQNIIDGHCSFSHNNKSKEVNQARVKKLHKKKAIVFMGVSKTFYRAESTNLQFPG